LLDSTEAVLGCARNMTYAQRHPEVEHITVEYAKGVRRSKAEMRKLQPWLERTAGLEKWAVLIQPPLSGPVNSLKRP
jgi:hypothetical protein